MSGHPGNLFSPSTTEFASWSLESQITRGLQSKLSKASRLTTPPIIKRDNLGLILQAHTFALLTGAGTWPVQSIFLGSTGQSRTIPLSLMGLPHFWSRRQIPMAEFQYFVDVPHAQDIDSFPNRLPAAEPPRPAGAVKGSPSPLAAARWNQRGRGNLGMMRCYMGLPNPASSEQPLEDPCNIKCHTHYSRITALSGE